MSRQYAWSVPIALLLSSSGIAQSEPGLRGLNLAIEKARRSGWLQLTQTLPVGELARQRSTTNKFPEPLGDESRVLEIIRSGSGGSSGKKVSIRDGSELIFRGYRCIANEVDGDTGTQIFTFRGDVRVIGKDLTITGETVTVDFRNKSFIANYGSAEIRPPVLQALATDSIFLKGREASGTKSRILGYDCEFTTCDKKEAHFHFDAGRSDIKPGKEIVLRKVDIVVLNRRLIRLPILIIPLGDRTFNYLPQVGQSPDEGFFVKNRYAFEMQGDDRGAVRLDYMSRLGAGVGAEYFYRSASSNGIAKVYGVFGNSKTLNVSSQHEQRFGAGVLTFDASMQRNNYLTAPSTTLLSTRGTFRFTGDQTILNFNNQSQTSASARSNNQTISLSDQRRIGNTNSALDLTLSGTTFSSGSATPTSRQTLDVRYRAQRDVALGTASLDYQRTIPIGDVENFFPGSDRTPVLTFASDSKRLFGSKASTTLPFRTEISTGEYLDPVTRRRITRNSFDLNWNRATRDQGPWKWDLNGGFRQGLYSDHTAQYRLNLGTVASYSLQKKLKANLRHTYLRPFGFSPLIIDRTGTSHNASIDFSVDANSRSSFGIQTGYDFERSAKGQLPWQQLGIRSDYRLNDAFSLRTLTTYDSFEQRWTNVRLDATWRSDDLSASLGARYDGIRQAWSNVNAYVDGLKLGRTRIGSLFNFNGYSGRLDSQQYNFVYDLHCAEAIFTFSDYGTGFRSGRELGFFIRLKAVPFDSSFGKGRRGQVLGSGTGRDF